jgi:7,8-dihydropterin-6-yl-methyl-4-(beta-D-ribofuranosyl)aminobenzene 5'-phosphate synthase
MSMSVTILCENCVGRPGLMGEHGFSALIERDGRRFLFDTGPGASLPQNTKILGKPLQNIDAIFISHGHYDHTGGLKYALQENGPVDVIAHSGIFQAHMAKSPFLPDSELRNVGCPHSKDDLIQAGARFQFTDQTNEIFPGIWFVSGIERKAEQMPRDPQLVLFKSGQAVQDPMSDDASIVLETPKGPVLILGCAHAGVLNILDHVKDNMGISRLRAILGGTHLMFFPPDQIDAVIDRFETFGIEQIAVSHCTGMKAAIELGAHFKNRFAAATAGSGFSFD